MSICFTFVGTGDAFGSGGRLNTCFHVEAPETTFLIDCGATAVPGLKRLGLGLDAIDTIVLSHLHGDHFGGLPFFLLNSHFVTRRRRPLTITGPEGLRDRLATLVEAMFPNALANGLRFPLTIVEMAPESEREIGALRIAVTEVRHPSGAPPFALRIGVAGRIIAYSGDTEWVEALVETARNADLFVCECYAFEGPAPYHLDYQTLSRRRADLTPKRMVLTHMSEPMLVRLDEVGPDFEIAEDGLVITL